MKRYKRKEIRKEFKLNLLLICCLLLCYPLLGQVQQESLLISPNEAVEMAIRNNLSLEAARVTTATRRRASDLSWNQFIPSLTLGGSLIMNNEQGTTTLSIPIPGTGTPISFNDISGRIDPTFFVSDPIDLPRWNLAGSIQTSLTISMAMFENMKRLRLDYESGLIAYEKAKLQLERDVRKAYNSMLLLQENIALLLENFEAAGRRVNLARANYNAGLVPELTLLQAQVVMENMKPIIDQAQNGLRLSMANFAMFLGLPYDTPFELQPLENLSAIGSQFIPLDIKDLISRAASGRPDILELRHSILLLQSARKAQTYSLLPALTLSWNTNRIFTGDPWGDNWFDGDLWRKSGSLTIALGVRLHSLIPFSQDFQGIKNMEDQIVGANIGLARLIQGTEIEVYNTVLSLDRTRITADAQAQTISLAERAYLLTEQAFRAGLQDLLQVQNAELELKQARVSMLEQQFNYLNSLLDLEYAIGVPFGTLSN